jgi:ACS family hexuronate transporter-like MFS transporter
MPMTAAGFVLARVALGLTEGANFPAAIKTVAEWFPVKERALATGWFNAGTNIGAVPWMFSHIGWASTFHVTGGTGFAWLITWWFAYDEPEKPLALALQISPGLGLCARQHVGGSGLGVLPVPRSGLFAETLSTQPP